MTVKSMKEDIPEEDITLDGYENPCPVGHHDFEECVKCEDNGSCINLRCGEVCVFANEEEEPKP